MESIQVASRNVGRIIGSRGSKIKEMQEVSQARIQVSREEDASGQTTVTITGSEDQIAKAKELIEQCTSDNRAGFSNRDSRGGGQRGQRDFRDEGRDSWRDSRSNDYQNRYNNVADEEEDWGSSSGQSEVVSDRSYQSNDWGGRNNGGDAWDGGRNNGGDAWNGGRNNRQDSFGGGRRDDSWGGGRNNREDSRGGFGSNGQTNDYDSQEGSWRDNGSSDSWRNDRNGSRGGRGGGFSSRGPREPREGRDFGGGGDREEIYVHSMETGRLIGAGGSKIKELQSESNCKIKVSRDGSNGVNLVELIGSLEQIEEAKKLISKAVTIVDQNGSRIGDDGSVEEVTEVKRRGPIDWSSVYKSSQERAKEKFKDLPPIIKNFYVELDDIADMSREEVMMIRKENNNILVECPDGNNHSFPNPVKAFEDTFHNYPLILEQIYKQNFVKPSPIQCQSWPVLLQGKDLIGIAQTGTGKTLAFLLPALIHIDSQPVPREQRKGPSALILSPTRELAQQIEVEVNKINYKGIRSICVYGGGNRRDQLTRCQKGVEIVVATPGRLNDFIMNGIIDVTNVTYLVMDEADRMLDLGFELEIKKVMMDIRPDRQTVMTSATWPDEVQHLADSYMTDPYKVFVGTLDLAAVHSVRQHVEICQDYEKKDMILEFIEQMGPQDKVIIFVGKKIIADDLSSDLAMSNIVCQCIHGDREQCDREAALSEFKDSTVRILVATDVASRGLDVPDITHVINYDFPRHIEEYVHRIGRTGRAGRSGVAITFVTRGDWRSAQQLIDIMTEADQEIPDDLVMMAERYSSFKQRRQEEGSMPGMRGRGGRGRGGGRGGRGRRRDDDDFFMM